MRHALLLIATLSFHPLTHAAEGYVSGAGRLDCKSLQEELKQQTTSDAAFQQWLLGYFSGANVAYGQRSKRGDVTTGATLLPGVLAEKILAKCSTQPDQQVSRVADEVYSELRQMNQ